MKAVQNIVFLLIAFTFFNGQAFSFDEVSSNGIDCFIKKEKLVKKGFVKQLKLHLQENSTELKDLLESNLSPSTSDDQVTFLNAGTYSAYLRIQWSINKQLVNSTSYFSLFYSKEIIFPFHSFW